LKDASFRIYRGWINGTVTHFRLNRDSSYVIQISEIQCSLCDFDVLNKTINSQGTWSAKNDTIICQSDHKKIKFVAFGDSIIRPLFIFGMSIDSIPKEKKEIYKNSLSNSDLNDFHLIYDTYPNGVAKMIADKYRMRVDESVIYFKPDGSIKSIDNYRNSKHTKKSGWLKSLLWQ
jgi:antitoxin component YwqK of YwqJK toxin-antitoxin module